MKHSRFRRSLSHGLVQALVAGQITAAWPTSARAASSPPPQKKADAVDAVVAFQAPPPVQVNRSVPAVVPPSARPHFSVLPAEAEIVGASVFEEPLVPMGETSLLDNRALANALESYVEAGDPEAFGPLTAFLADHPRSPWRPALLANLGLLYRRTGYFSRALEAWQEAWGLSRDAREPRAKALADATVSQLADLTGHLGRVEALDALLAEVDARDIGGAAGERLATVRQGRWQMEHQAGTSFRCGPFALEQVWKALHAGGPIPERLASAQSSRRGTSLRLLSELAEDVRLDVHPARRLGRADVPLPAVVHWKSGHFAALLEERDGRYRAFDPTFDHGDFWVSRRALDEEASGYFMIPTPRDPAEWADVRDDVAVNVEGKGFINAWEPPPPTQPQTGPCPSQPMAAYTLQLYSIGLRVFDTPVGYVPPLGPPVRFEVDYNQREIAQPANFNYSNLGPKWTFKWLSYIEEDPANTQRGKHYAGGGGQTTYTLGVVDKRSQGVLARVQTAPIVYELRWPDGSKDVFSVPVGTAPRKVFMSQSRDPQGLTMTYTYDAQARLVAVTDALGQVTTLTYGSADPLKITRVTDPFGRFATFDYASGRLTRITDVIGIASEFTYAAGDFLSSFTTPYGTTSFTTGEGANFNRWVEAVDPLGGRERIEFSQAAVIPSTEPPNVVPEGFASHNISLAFRNTYYWDKRASMLYPGDWTKAHVYHWLHGPVAATPAPVLESEKRPLENRVWYAYAGQPAPWMEGAISKPSVIARVLDSDVGSREEQTYRYEYNARGKTIKETDPLGRETVHVFGTQSTPDPDPVSGTGIDLLQVKQRNGATYDVLSTRTYDDRHRLLSSTDASNQTTTYTYNASGQPLTVVTPPRAGLTPAQRTTTYTYDTTGYLQAIAASSPAATTRFTYDGYGRARTITDPDGYTLTHEFDALDRLRRVSYPDGTYEEGIYNRLDLERQRDRRGRWSETLHDALRRPAALRDPLGRTTTQTWCACGSLDRVADANGNSIAWERDLQGRMTREVRADGAAWEYTYDSENGRLFERRDARNQITRHTYFADNMPRQVSYPSAAVATPSVSYTYDPAYSRTLTVTDGAGTTVYAYNPVTGALGSGALASIDGPHADDIVSYTYEELGRVATRGLSGWTSSIAYDGLDRPATQGTPLGTFAFEYDGVTSRVLSLTYPNGQKTMRSHLPGSGDHRLQQIRHFAPDGTTVISRYDYTYDSVGDIASVTQRVGTSPAKLYAFGYDAARQLTAAAITGPSPLPTPSRYAYAYDRAGNRTAEQLDDVVTGTSHNARNQATARQPGGTVRVRGALDEAALVNVNSRPAEVAPDNAFVGQAAAPAGTSEFVVQATDAGGNARTNRYRVTQAGASTSYAYDANGNLVSDGTRTYEWNAENQLTAVRQGNSVLASFAYDARGRRWQKTAAGLSTTYVYDEDQVIEERLSNGARVQHVSGPGIDRHWATRDGAGTTTYLLADHLGTIVQATSASGVVVLARDYDPYGVPLTAAGQSGLAYTGREWDAETGLYYYRARYYSPTMGRFISEDPIGLEGGINLYAYVQNRPVGLVDPFGLDPTPLAACALEAQANHKKCKQQTAALRLAGKLGCFSFCSFSLTSNNMLGFLRCMDYCLDRVNASLNDRDLDCDRTYRQALEDCILKHIPLPPADPPTNDHIPWC